MNDLIGQAKLATNLQPTCNQLATDTISRQAAIDAVNNICPVDTEYDCTLLDRVDVRCVLLDLPSAERKKGRWVRIEDENGDFLCWECSECGDRYVMPYHRASYCPNCGAEMRGEEE